MKRIMKVTKGVIVFLAVVLAGSFLIFSVQKKISSELSRPSLPVPSPSLAAVSRNATPTSVQPEPPKIRYVSGIIKEVKKNSIVVMELTGGEVEISFDSNTKFLKGEGSGVAGGVSDLAVDWNVAIFMPEDQNNNTAQTIQLVTKKAGS